MYAAVSDITAAFPTAQWDPTRHEPGTATVEGWLDDASDHLDGQLANVVEVPVDETDSPHLYQLCRGIVARRVQADVYDAKWPPKPSEPVTTRQSQVWRGLAEDDLERILAGAIADGVAASGPTDRTTKPSSYFGGGTFPEHRERKW